MDSLACPACGYDPSKDSNFDGKPKKLCGRCTLKLGPDANDRVGKFKDWLNQALLEDSSVPDSDLVEEGANFGLPHLASKKIVEAIKEEISRLPQGKLLIYYDVETTSAAIACGKTVVPLQIENGLPQSLEKVEVHVAHPETGVLVSAVAIPGLLRRKTKETEIHLELQAIGIHTIRNGFIVATGNSGASEVYQLAESIRIQAKDGAVSTTSINHWSQNITTHGSASVLADGRQSSQSSPGAKWKSVRVIRSNKEALLKFNDDCRLAGNHLIDDGKEIRSFGYSSFDINAPATQEQNVISQRSQNNPFAIREQNLKAENPLPPRVSLRLDWNYDEGLCFIKGTFVFMLGRNRKVRSESDVVLGIKESFSTTGADLRSTKCRSIILTASSQLVPYIKDSETFLFDFHLVPEEISYIAVVIGMFSNSDAPTFSDNFRLVAEALSQQTGEILTSTVIEDWNSGATGRTVLMISRHGSDWVASTSNCPPTDDLVVLCREFGVELKC